MTTEFSKINPPKSSPSYVNIYQADPKLCQLPTEKELTDLFEMKTKDGVGKGMEIWIDSVDFKNFFLVAKKAFLFERKIKQDEVKIAIPKKKLENFTLQ